MIPKISQRELMFLAGGTLIGYVLVPSLISHHVGGCTGKCGSPCGAHRETIQILGQTVAYTGVTAYRCNDSGCPKSTISCDPVTGQAYGGQGSSAVANIIGAIANGIGGLFKGTPQTEEVPVG